MGAFMANTKVLMMFAVLILLFVAIGWAIGSLFPSLGLTATMLIFFVIAVGINVVSYFFSDTIILKMYRAKVVSEAESPRMHRIVRDLSQRAQLPMPRVAIVPSQNPNAFATGRTPKKAVVAATEGLLRTLDDNELTGVLAHELAHVKNRDVLVMTVAATVAGAVAFAARIAFWGSMFNRSDNWIIILLVAVTLPIAALLVQLAISRSREYKADAKGAELCGRPLWLASALRKLDAGVKQYPMDNSHASPSTSSLFIVNPFRGGAIVSMLSTHPPMQERIRRLEQMASEKGQYR
jgi:heat shock protein HtpX